MPTIELLGDSHDVGRLLAVMLFPTDSAKRDQYLAVRIARAEVIQANSEQIAGSREIRVSLNLLRLLLEAPSYEALKAEAAELTKRAMLAGMLLSIVYLMARLKLEAEPSINKAIFALSEYAKSTEYGDQTPIQHSEESIREAWREFRPVAHLWSAVDINRSYPFAPENEQFSQHHLPTFLQVAAGQLDFASTFIPKRRREPLIERPEAWEIPRPYSDEPRNLTRGKGRKPDRLLSILKHYRAPKAR